jgi:hypothetical protein
MKAKLVFRDKFVYADGAIREMVIWQLPEKDIIGSYGLKYRLFYGYPNKCLVRYDNEGDKGNHRHYGDREEAYIFVSVAQLISDFRMDIERLRGDRNE